MLITTNDLESQLKAKDLIIIDTRSYQEYSDGHVPGAVNLDLYAFHWIDSTKEGIENFRKQSESLFSFVGITHEKKVVFYDNFSGMVAARGVWMLNCFSHQNVFMLDGGITKWKDEEFPLETKTNPFTPTKFSGKFNPKILTGFEEIRDNLDSLTIIDARSAEEYDGTVVRAGQAGHIPNSINIDWNKNINNSGTFKTKTELENLYPFPKDSKIVTYCQGAYRAANTFLVLKSIGFENVRVYLGSWGEWGNHLELPVEK